MTSAKQLKRQLISLQTYLASAHDCAREAVAMLDRTVADLDQRDVDEQRTTLMCQQQAAEMDRLRTRIKTLEVELRNAKLSDLETEKF